MLNPEALVSMNFWVLNPSLFIYLKEFFNQFLNQNPNEKTEFYLPFAIDELIKNDRISVQTKVADEAWKGITYPEDKTDIQEFIKLKTASKIYPENLWT